MSKVAETCGRLFIRFPLSNGNRLELWVDKPISKKDFDLLRQIIDLSKDSLVAEPESEQPGEVNDE